MTSENEAAKNVGTLVERLLAGWPIYSVVAVALFAYSELWIEKKIQEGIAIETGNTSLAVLVDNVKDVEASVKANGDAIRELNGDVKATLRLLAGHNDD